MSLLANTPTCPAALRTDLGDAFEAHVTTHADDAYALGCPDTAAWLNVMRHRACHCSDAVLLDLTNQMLVLLADPSAAGASFKASFLVLYDQACRHAYPLASALRDEQHALVGLTQDYTLSCFDFGMLRVIEDDAIDDSTLRSFIADMLKLLSDKKPRHQVLAARLASADRRSPK
jgi:hypothetical protein